MIKRTIIIIILSVFTGFLLHESPAQDSPTIFIKNLNAGSGTWGTLSKTISDEIMREIVKCGKYQVMSQDMVKQLMDNAGIQMSLGCNSEECIKQIMKTTQADYILYGDIKKEAKEYIISINLMHRKEGGNAVVEKTARQYTEDISTRMLEKVAKNLVAELHGEEPSADDTTKTQGSGTLSWNPIMGEWLVQKNHLIQTNIFAQPSLIIANNFNKSIYTLTLKARKNSGAEGFILLFHYQNSNRWVSWNIGGWNNTKSAMEYDGFGAMKILSSTLTNTRVKNNQWYDIKIMVHNHRFKSYIDDALVLDTTLPETMSGKGTFGFATWSSSCEFKDVAVH